VSGRGRATAAPSVRELAGRVVDPEMPMLTLADLGVLRDVAVHDRGVTVTITPTYAGCPALATMRDDLVRVLTEAGHGPVEVAVQLAPAWSSDDITAHGREQLRRHGLSAPGAAPDRSGPVPLSLGPTRREVACPRCGARADLTSEFGPTACTALYACSACGEPFEHVKEI
jgi:ring-1,2-phenylacetyl-CoA epoxidase subunit PaaD